MLDDFALDRISRRCVRFRHVDGAAADDRAAACASTQFRQGHPHRHERHFLVAGASPAARSGSGNEPSLPFSRKAEAKP